MSIGQGPERRRGSRFVVADPRFDATLQIGRHELPAAILDESAGGFSILVEEDPGVKADEVVRLRTETYCCEVRVAYVGRAGKETGCRGYRLGLQRLRELERPLSVEKLPWKSGPDPLMPGQSIAGSLLFILALIIALPLIVGGVIFGLDEKRLKRLGDWFGSGTRPAESTTWNGGLRHFLPGEEPSGETTPSRSTFAGDGPALPGGKPFRAILDHMPGADVFLLPEIAERLALTPAQKQRLRELVDATNEALDQFDKYTQGDSRQERSRKREMLFAEVRKKALEILTPAQRARWDALQAGPTP